MNDVTYTFGMDVFDNQNTNIWSTKKIKWIKGPPILSSHAKLSYYYSDFQNLCIIILNRTTVMLIGGNGLVKTENSFGTFWHFHSNLVFTIDVHQNIWRRYPNIPIEGIDGINLATGLSTDKLENRYIVCIYFVDRLFVGVFNILSYYSRMSNIALKKIVSLCSCPNLLVPP